MLNNLLTTLLHSLPCFPLLQEIEADPEDASGGKSPACATDMVGQEEAEEEIDEEDQEMAEKSADKAALSGGERIRKRQVNWQEVEKDDDSDFEW